MALQLGAAVVGGMGIGLFLGVMITRRMRSPQIMRNMQVSKL